MTEPELPELPEPHWAGYVRIGPMGAFDDDQLRAYGLQCYEAGVKAERERCAELVASKAQWGPCDCGCPGGRSPKDTLAIELIRVAAALRKGWADRVI